MADEFQYIKLPDGSYGKFAADASDSVIQQQIAKDFPDVAAADEEKAFTKARQESATQDPTFQKLAGAVLPTVAAGAALIPGPQQPYLANVFGQSILGATATAANQAMGFEPSDATEVIKSAIAPAVAMGVIRTGKAFTKGATEIVAPGVLKEAGVEAGAESIGSPASSLQRAFTTPLSQSLYKNVAQQGPVPTADLTAKVKNTIDELSSLSNPPRPAIKYLKNLYNKYSPQEQIQFATSTPAPQPKIVMGQSGYRGSEQAAQQAPTSLASLMTNTTAPYGQLVDEVQLIKQNADRAFRAGNVPTGKALMKMRGDMLDELDKVSPAIKAANAQFRKEEAARDVVAALRSSNASNKLRSLFENDPLVSGTYKPEDFKTLERLAMEITEAPSAGAVGLGRTLLMAATEPIAQALTTQPGRYLVRQLMKPTGKITDVGAITIAQFMRAYNASSAKVSDTPEFKENFSNTMRSFDIPIDAKIKSALVKDRLERATDTVNKMFETFKSNAKELGTKTILKP